jgi:hypothetical protein
MFKQLTLWSVLIAMVGLTAPVFAQDDTDEERSAADVAAKCIERAQRVAERCADRNGAIADRTIELVERLLDAGHLRRAQRAAHRGIVAINRNSDRCVRKIHRHCERCTHWLVEHGYEDLAAEVRAACGEALEHVRDSQRRAVGAIRHLFENGD